ncbi:phosphatase PAP2 family protein [Sphingomonas sp. RIT328]|uniref:phosphatase PAP2 family protein n=1 Tax=Sphingomonas sp. RIT328 TaxID=1470591 RepID=UPI00044E7B2A|nr:phosphatase PAP2 family protein [Sphingomonas sp. RIT328]EZP52693.1 PAP2 superfamily protein [Sphingomonas sp. RIT328]
MTRAAVPAQILARAALLALGGGLLLGVSALFATGRVTGFDPAILLWTRNQTGDHGWLITIAGVVTVMGNNVTLWIATAVAIAVCAVRRRWLWCAYLACTTAGGAVIISAIKAAVARPRPTIVSHLVDVHTPSFPSGHAMDSAFVYGSIAVVIVAGAGGGRRWNPAVVAAMLLVFAIGASRIVLGVHWPTDVAAGWAVGLCWTATVTQVFGRRIGGESRTFGKQTLRLSEPK